jgi:hypothetical protein
MLQGGFMHFPAASHLCGDGVLAGVARRARVGPHGSCDSASERLLGNFPKRPALPLRTQSGVCGQ